MVAGPLVTDNQFPDHYGWDVCQATRCRSWRDPTRSVPPRGPAHVRGRAAVVWTNNTAANQTKALEDAKLISDAAEDNNQTVADYYQENRDKAEEDRQEAERQQEAEQQEKQANVDASGSSSRPDNSAAAYSGSVQGKEFGRATGGLIKKPTKKKTKK